MTEAEYNAQEGIRRSDLWRMEDSPEKFKWFLEHPIEQTPAMAFGSVCHKMILEPGEFWKEYCVAPDINRRTNAGKAEWEAFCADNAGKEIISKDDADVISDMELRLEQCKIAWDLLHGGQTEVPIFWKDPETGEQCKAKLDVLNLNTGRMLIVDYKTTANADTARFNAEIWKRGYHFQAGMYAEGLMLAGKLDYMPKFYFVAQEKKAPYSVNVIEVSDEVMKAGREKFHELLQKYHECKEVDIWPGYVEDVANDTFVPGWYEEEDYE